MRPLTLVEAFSLCAVRRLRGALARAPLLAVGAALLAVAAPFLLVRGGDRAGSAAASFVVDPATARLLVLPLLVGAAAAGAVVALLVPDGSGLDPQLRAAPVTRVRLLAAAAFAPVAGVSVVMAAFLLLTAFPLAAHLPGGRGAAVVVLAATGAACAAGAALAEAAVAAARGAPQATLGAVVPAAAVASAPLDPVARALVDSSAVGGAVVRGSSLWLVASATWAVLLLLRPPPPPARTMRPLLPVPRGPALAWFATALARYARRAELRRAGAAGIAFGALGAGLTSASGSSGSTVLVLAATTALVGACAFPLAQHGLDLRARWIWLAARGCAGAAPGAGGAAAAVLAASVVATAALGALLLTGGADTIAGVAVVTCLATALALLAGVMLPWRGDRLSDQLAAFGLLAGLGLCVSFAAGAAAGPLLEVVPEPVFAAIVLAAPLAAALFLSVRSFGRLD